MNKEQKIIDVWMQHPNLDFINHDMFASLRRWMGIDKVTEEIPVEISLSAMDEGYVQKGLICAWWGPGGEMIAVATKHPNVFIDTSAYTAKRFPAELIHYMKTTGKKKVLFGTNYPMITPAKCLEDLDGLELSQEVRDLFLYKNAKSLFDI